MVEPKLWCLHKGTRSIYFCVGPINCLGCSKEIPFGEQLYHLVDWNPSRPGEYVFCHECIKKGVQPKGPVPANWYSQERRTAIVVESFGGLPDGVFPVQLSHHGLTDSRNISTFKAASQKYALSERVTDCTKLAGRADSTFLDDNAPVLIGADVKATIDGNDQVLETSEGLKLLDELVRGDDDEP